LQSDTVWVSLVRGLAKVWIALHVAISVLHSWQQFVMHAIVFAVFAFFLFRSAANQYFQAEAG